jgi:hypothetical protein
MVGFLLQCTRKKPISMQEEAFVRSIENRQEWQTPVGICLYQYALAVHERKFQLK